MGLLDTCMGNDAEFLVNPDEHGEAITYTPSGSSAVSINAVVQRNVMSSVPGTEDTLAEDLVISIRNHATAGVTSVNRGKDVVSVARREGESAATLTVVEILEQDGAMWTLQLR